MAARAPAGKDVEPVEQLVLSGLEGGPATDGASAGEDEALLGVLVHRSWDDDPEPPELEPEGEKAGGGICGFTGPGRCRATNGGAPGGWWDRLAQYWESPQSPESALPQPHVGPQAALFVEEVETIQEVSRSHVEEDRNRCCPCSFVDVSMPALSTLSAPRCVHAPGPQKGAPDPPRRCSSQAGPEAVLGLESSPERYVAFLELLLQTAEKHFMAGHRVTCYVFTDRPGDVPRMPLGEGRQVGVLEVRSYSRRQDVSVHRVEMIRNFSRRRFLHEVDSPVCADVDVSFRDHVGVEIPSPLFGTLHPGFYGVAREAFTYERRPQSQAHVPRDEGDFYYAGGFFGGSVAEVLRLTSACHQATVVDRAHGIEAVWHDESHLNRYLLDHKPTKVLSPEYLWDEQLLGWPAVVKKLRYVTVPKSHRGIRD
ncbi:histo-blood group ABO system transferase 2-like [Lynx rufus]|uniref:histo-blood group ABO system transferase 2-like n=1 Tax=Lynx rufus TaxID=61384 RepID=UPI001F125D9A|nr:histo-blood group ABO system transferase 2-like [Lynx rufus]